MVFNRVFKGLMTNLRESSHYSRSPFYVLKIYCNTFRLMYACVWDVNHRKALCKIACYTR